MEKHAVFYRFLSVWPVGAAKMENTLTAAEFLDEIDPLDGLSTNRRIVSWFHFRFKKLLRMFLSSSEKKSNK